jgi:uncharacterized protein
VFQELHIQVIPQIAADTSEILKWVKTHHDLPFDPTQVIVLKRSIDARQKQIKMQLRIWVADEFEQYNIPPFDTEYRVDPSKAHHRIVIVGAGPAGLFAALQFLRMGYKPIVIERGKDVQSRRRDLAQIHKAHEVNPESNYCFGEGGAGTYSDGKLYTRSTKRGDVQEVLRTLVHFGASQDIMVDAHPHIGTNKLPKVVAAMREAIRSAGGEVHFDTKLTDLELGTNCITAIEVNGSTRIEVDTLILATGHSARDIFELLQRKDITIEFKSFALGVRVEHPQKVIDQAQYHCQERGPFLPPAAYALVEQVEGKGVYSFCMCPGGIIAPCATSKGEVVTNGWSPSKRNNPWANSGMVVSVEWSDIPAYHQFGALAGMAFQRDIEQLCQKMAGGTQAVPAQRISDFLMRKKSTDLPSCSYQPGIVSVQMDDVLPAFIVQRLRTALKLFGKKIKGFSEGEALMVAPESRTSSPVRIPRNESCLHHPKMANLYPCAEGAGYAGGIVSAAIDGIKVAQAVDAQISKQINS